MRRRCQHPYVCPHCAVTTRTIGGLSAHLRIMHPVHSLRPDVMDRLMAELAYFESLTVR